MKLLYVLIALLLVIGIGYYATNSDEQDMRESDAMMEEGGSMEAVMMEDDGSANGVMMESDRDDAMMEEGGAMEGAMEAPDAMMEGNDAMMGSEQEFTLDSFMFGYSMKEITVKQGDTVTINLTNSGGSHDWVVDEFNARTDVIPAGETTSVTFVADKKGTFEYYCSVGSHRARGMVGTLIVE